MYKKKLYKNLLVYLDASSFSQFKSYCSELSKVHALLAITDTTDIAYCNAKVKKTLVGACLGTKFGVTWMEKTDKTKDFILTPDFSVPKWSKGALWYQIMPDSFFNGDVLNDKGNSGLTQENAWGNWHFGGEDYFGGDLDADDLDDDIDG